MALNFSAFQTKEKRPASKLDFSSFDAKARTPSIGKLNFSAFGTKADSRLKTDSRAPIDFSKIQKRQLTPPSYSILERNQRPFPVDFSKVSVENRAPTPRTFLPNTELRAAPPTLTQKISQKLPEPLRKPFESVTTQLKEGLFGSVKDRAAIREFEQQGHEPGLPARLTAEGFLPFIGRTDTDKIEHISSKLVESGVDRKRASEIAFLDVQGQSGKRLDPRDKTKEETEKKLGEMKLSSSEKQVLMLAHLGQFLGSAGDVLNVLPIGSISKGGRPAFIKALVGAKTEDEAAKVLSEMGIPENWHMLLKRDVVNIGDEKAANALVDYLEKNLKETRAAREALARGDTIPPSQRTQAPATRAAVNVPENEAVAAGRYWDDVVVKAGDDQPLVFSGDDMKKHFGDDYAPERSDFYSRANYENVVRAITEGRRSELVFLGGGPGAGKTEFVGDQLLAGGYKGILYDTTFSSPEGVKKLIDLARSKNISINVHGILADLDRARGHTVLREAETGRPVADEAFARGHAGFINTLRTALENKWLDPSEVRLYDFRGVSSYDEAREVIANGKIIADPLAALRNVRYTEGQIKVAYARANFDAKTGRRHADTGSGEKARGLFGKDRTDTENLRGGEGADTGQVVQQGRVIEKPARPGEITFAQLEATSRKIRALGNKTGAELAREVDEIKLEISFYKDFKDELPGKQLIRFRSVKEGEFLDFKDPKHAKTKSERERIIERNRRVMQASESAFEGTINADKFDDPDIIREAIGEYLTTARKVKELEKSRILKAKELALRTKQDLLLEIATEGRTNARRALDDLTDDEVLHMDRDTFGDYMKGYLEEREMHRQARMALEATIQEKELKNWEAVRDALKLPKSFSEMTRQQILALDDVLAEYQKWDEFLPARMQESLRQTELAGARTQREVLTHLAEKTDSPLHEAVRQLKLNEFQVFEKYRYMGDHLLSRQHPFFKYMTWRKNKGLIEAQARTLSLVEKMDELLKAARKSIKRGVGDRIAPTDKRIVQWLESGKDPAKREFFASHMSADELKAAQFMDATFRGYYKYLVGNAQKLKYSRFVDRYFPHVRRSFLEAWKEDGLVKAFGEMREKYAQEEVMMGILNQRTGEVLPYEKWVSFAQVRTGTLVPTQNAGKAFEAYVLALEKAKYLDEMIPEMMAYVHTLSPKGLTPRGLDIDQSLKSFVKEWINANKGRPPQAIFQPGGKYDWTLRMATAFVRVMDLGFNVTTQLAAPFGEQGANLLMLGAKQYTVAQVRLKTAQGRAIVRKYRNFTGRTIWDELSRPSADVGDKLITGLLAGFGRAVRKGNEIFLLGKLTQQEFKTGKISSERLATLMVEMNKYRAVKGVESIMGRTGEGQALKQYKTWAIPLARATYTNLRDLSAMVRRDGVKALNSEEGRQLFYSSMIVLIALGVKGYYEELGEKKDRSFFEDMTYKNLRESLSLIGAFDPRMWVAPRLISFMQDLADAAYNLALLEEYKTTGELKGPVQLGRLFTPRAVKQFLPKENSGGGGTTVGGLDFGFGGGGELQSIQPLDFGFEPLNR